MTKSELNEARQRANFVLRVRDELDVVNYLPEAERLLAATKIFADARREYGPTWTSDGIEDELLAVNDAPEHMHENILNTLVFAHLAQRDGAS